MKNSWKLILFAHLSYIPVFSMADEPEPARADADREVEILTPEIAGEWLHVFNPNDAREEHKGKWYCNDHSIVQDANGHWHAYGIIGFRPAKPWDEEKRFFHASSPSLLEGGQWKDHGYVFSVKPGKEAVVWAPHVLHIEDTLWMFYNAGNMQEHARKYASWGTMRIARSPETDGHQWKRDKLNPLFSDPGHARDSFVCNIDKVWHWYYTCTVNEVDLRSAVKVRTSPDLKHWSGPRVVHIQAKGGHWGGNAESPQVISIDGIYYLFVTLAMEGYDKTNVYWSKDPHSFPRKQFVTELEAHAPELIRVNDGQWFITTCGWDKSGLYLAPLNWTAKK